MSPPASDRGAAMGGLIVVELRKAVDTRAARWLLAVVAGLCVVAAGLRAETAQLPVTVLLPVLGTLTATSEWSQRTALTTFTLEPRRVRVVAAKLAAVTVLAVGVGLLAVLAAALAAGAAPEAAVAGQLLLVDVATMLCGYGFGLVLFGSAPAITAYYVVPTAWALAGRLVPALEPAAGWLDLSRTQVPLAADVTAEQWLRFAASVALWVLLPLALGTVRTVRADVR